MSQNKIFLIGRIGQDPEITTVGSTTVTKFSLATSEKWTDKDTGEVKELTQWHNIEAWGKRGEVISKYHEKGDMIHLEGKLVYDKWEDKEGNKRITAKVRVEGFTFIKNQKESKKETAKPEPVPTPEMGKDVWPDDDLPF